MSFGWIDCSFLAEMSDFAFGRIVFWLNCLFDLPFLLFEILHQQVLHSAGLIETTPSWFWKLLISASSNFALSLLLPDLIQISGSARRYVVGSGGSHSTKPILTIQVTWPSPVRFWVSLTWRVMSTWKTSLELFLDFETPVEPGKERNRTWTH